ncbi:antibiotic biosynthesis monooxygenase [Leisingera sp. JC11]|uniref:putative quinol monooxygenase n=1 Tax=Leisingera sp. JC11 TaxID=3042469 RepID=UPI003451C69D
MTEAVIIDLHPRPGKFNELTVLVKQMVEEVRRHAGCLQAEILLAPERDKISVFQKWQDPEAFSEYLIWRSKQEHLDRVYALSEAEPDLSSYTLCEPG